MKTLLIVLSGFTLAYGQELPSGLTGNLRYDLLVTVRTADTAAGGGEIPDVRQKSPLRAAAYSALIPGTGEFYAGEYWRSAVFFGAEVALWAVYGIYGGKGDTQTEEFEAYGDSYWSVVKYAEWMEMHGSSLNTAGTPPPTGIVTSNDPNLRPWEQVNWALLNEWEQFIGGRASTGFSHRLPKRPEQQYYELIGKYLQYNVGWPEWNAAVSAGYLDGPTPRFAEYRDMRGRANDFYTTARTATYIIVLNHLVSALDAALSANMYNQSVRMETHILPTQRSAGIVEFVPTAVLTVTF